MQNDQLRLRRKIHAGRTSEWSISNILNLFRESLSRERREVQSKVQSYTDKAEAALQ